MSVSSRGWGRREGRGGTSPLQGYLSHMLIRWAQSVSMMAHVGARDRGYILISHKVFATSFCKSRFTHESVNSSFDMTNINNKLTGFCGNQLSKSDFINTSCEMKTQSKVDSMAESSESEKSAQS